MISSFRKSRIVSLGLAVLVLSFVLAVQSKTISDKVTEAKTKKYCSQCDYCDKRCADYDESNPEYNSCTMTQLFCCGRRDKCSPFSYRKIPPWGWGLITMAILTLLAIFVFWFCAGRPQSNCIRTMYGSARSKNSKQKPGGTQLVVQDIHQKKKPSSGSKKSTKKTTEEDSLVGVTSDSTDSFQELKSTG